MHKLKYLSLRRSPVLRMLHLEEGILRGDLKSNSVWLISNQPPLDSKTIVLGLSGQLKREIDINKAKTDRIKVIRRFTGGGTVITDLNTIFVSLIGPEDFLKRQGWMLYPREIMKWTETFYKGVFENLDFKLEETDYVISGRKFGGNSQAITRNRFVHHTSFLWDFDERNMACLLMPQRQPKYREQRSHQDFLCRMKEFVASPDWFLQRVVNEVGSLCAGGVEEVTEEEAEEFLGAERIGSVEVDLNNLNQEEGNQPLQKGQEFHSPT